MKKISALLLVAAMILSLAACGKENKKQNNGNGSKAVSTVTDNKTESSDVSEPSKKDAENEKAVTVSDETDVSNDDENDVSDDDTDKNTDSDTSWREFLAEYEDWVDRYIELVNKYKADPTNTELLSEYTDMLSDLTEWSEKSSDVQLDVTDPTEAAEYAAELLRIVNKLNEITE